MLFNKDKLKKVNDKKVLHKIKKHWVTISIAMLSVIGGGTTVTYATVNADNTSSNNNEQANHQLNNNQLNRTRNTLINDQSNHSREWELQQSSSSDISRQVSHNANALHDRIVTNAIQEQPLLDARYGASQNNDINYQLQKVDKVVTGNSLKAVNSSASSYTQEISSLANETSLFASDAIIDKDQQYESSLNSYNAQFRSLSTTAQSDINDYNSAQVMVRSYNNQASSVSNIASSENNSASAIPFSDIGSYESLMTKANNDANLATRYAKNASRYNASADGVTDQLANSAAFAIKLYSSVSSIGVHIKSVSHHVNPKSKSNPKPSPSQKPKSSTNNSFVSSAEGTMSSLVAVTNELSSSANSVDANDKYTKLIKSYAVKNQSLSNEVSLGGNDYLTEEDSLSSVQNAGAVLSAIASKDNSVFTSINNESQTQSNAALATSAQNKALSAMITADIDASSAKNESNAVASITTKINNNISQATKNYSDVSALSVSASKSTLDSTSALHEINSASVVISNDVNDINSIASNPNVISDRAVDSNLNNDKGIAFQDESNIEADLSKVNNIAANNASGAVVAITSALSNAQLDLSEANDSASNNYKKVQPGPITVDYINQNGKHFTTNITGQINQYGNNITNLATIPAGYNLNPGQSLGYKFTANSQTDTLRITGQQRLGSLKVGITKVDSNKNTTSYANVPVSGLVGNDYVISPSNYIPQGYNLSNSDKDVTGQFTVNDISNNQPIDFTYVKNTPTIFTRKVQVPVYINNVSHGTQLVKITGTINENINLTSGMANNISNYNKSVIGYVTVGKINDNVHGQFSYTSIPLPTPQPAHLNSQFVSSAHGTMASLAIATDLLSSQANSINNNDANTELIDSYAVKNQSLSNVVTSEGSNYLTREDSLFSVQNAGVSLSTVASEDNAIFTSINNESQTQSNAALATSAQNKALSAMITADIDASSAKNESNAVAAISTKINNNISQADTNYSKASTLSIKPASSSNLSNSISALNEIHSASVVIFDASNDINNIANNANVIKDHSVTSNINNDKRIASQDENNIKNDLSKVNNMTASNASGTVITTSLALSNAKLILSKANASVANNHQRAQVGSITVDYVNQNGKHFNKSITGQLNQNGNDITRLVPLPAGYSLDTKQSLKYEFTTNPQIDTLHITGQQRSYNLKIGIIAVNNNQSNKNYTNITVSGLVGNGYTIDPSKYVPQGYHLSNNDKTVTGQFTADGVSNKQPINYTYIKNIPAIFTREVQVPVYINHVSHGTQSVKITGDINSNVDLTNNMAKNISDYNKSVNGYVTIGKVNDTIHGQFNYTSIPTPRPKLSRLSSQFVSSADSTMASLVTATNSLSTRADSINSNNANTKLINSYALDNQTLSTAVSSEGIIHGTSNIINSISNDITNDISKATVNYHSASALPVNAKSSSSSNNSFLVNVINSDNRDVDNYYHAAIDNLQNSNVRDDSQIASTVSNDESSINQARSNVSYDVLDPDSIAENNANQEVSVASLITQNTVQLLSEANASAANDRKPIASAAPITIDYINRNGQQFDHTIYGNLNQGGNDITKLVAIPNGYQLNSNQRVNYQFTSQPQVMRLNIVGKTVSRVVKVNIHLVNGNKSSNVVKNTNITGIVGDSYIIDPQKYVPNNYHLANDSQIVGQFTSNGVSKPEVNFTYVHNTINPVLPKKFNFSVQVPVYINGNSSGTQQVSITGSDGEIINLTDDMAHNKSDYNKSVMGNILVDHGHGDIRGQIDYTGMTENRNVNIPVYINSHSNGTQTITISGKVGTVVNLNNNIANDRRGYNKSVKGNIMIIPNNGYTLGNNSGIYYDSIPSSASNNSSAISLIKNDIVSINSYDSTAVSYDNDATKDLSNFQISPEDSLYSLDNSDISEVNRDISLAGDDAANASVINVDINYSNNLSSVATSASNEVVSASKVAQDANMILNGDVSKLANKLALEKAQHKSNHSASNNSNGGHVTPPSSNSNNSVSAAENIIKNDESAINLYLYQVNQDIHNHEILSNAQAFPNIQNDATIISSASQIASDDQLDPNESTAINANAELSSASIANSNASQIASSVVVSSSHSSIPHSSFHNNPFNPVKPASSSSMHNSNVPNDQNSLNTSLRSNNADVISHSNKNYSSNDSNKNIPRSFGNNESSSDPNANANNGNIIPNSISNSSNNHTISSSANSSSASNHVPSSSSSNSSKQSSSAFLSKSSTSSRSDNSAEKMLNKNDTPSPASSGGSNKVPHLNNSYSKRNNGQDNNRQDDGSELPSTGESGIRGFILALEILSGELGLIGYDLDKKRRHNK